MLEFQQLLYGYYRSIIFNADKFLVSAIKLYLD